MNLVHMLTKAGKKSRRRSTPKNKRRRLRLENLEDRNLMTAGLLELDTSFGIDGRVRSDIAVATVEGYSHYGTAGAVVAQADGKVVVAVHSDTDFRLVRFDQQGAIDTGFGDSGFASFGFVGLDGIGDLAIQPDGKIVAVGQTVVAVGQTDWGGFSYGYDTAIARFTADGSPDPSFGDSGIVQGDFGYNEFANTVAIQTDGKIVVAGSISSQSQDGNSDVAVWRYLEDGSLDQTFGWDGLTEVDFGVDYRESATDLAIQNDGKIIVVGKTNGNGFVLRLDRSGIRDSAFVSVTTSGSVSHVIVQPIDGEERIVVSAGSGAERYHSDGSLDSGFDGSSSFGQLALGPGNRLIFARTSDSDFRAELVEPDSRVQRTLCESSIITTDFGHTEAVSGVAVLPDGKVVVVGTSVLNSNTRRDRHVALARYTLQTPDASLFCTPDGSVVTATATGDVDGDGDTERFTAFGDPSGWAYIFRSDSGDGIGVPIYHSNTPGTWNVQALALGDTDGNGIAELYSAFEHANGGAYIYRSNDGQSIGSNMWGSKVAGTWTVQALAAGDTNGDGRDELYSALERSNGDARIFRSENGDGLGERIYKSSVAGTWTVQALAVGDVDGDGDDELFTAFEHASGEARIYRSESGLGIGGQIYRSSAPGTWTVRALAVGDVDGDGDDELFSAFENVNGYSCIYRSETGNGIGQNIYSFDTVGDESIRALTLGDTDGDGRDEFFAALHRNGDAEFYRSDSGLSIGERIF